MSIIIDSSNDVDNSLTGLVCMKLADKFDKPCILLNKKANNSQGNDNIFVLDNLMFALFPKSVAHFNNSLFSSHLKNINLMEI